VWRLPLHAVIEEKKEVDHCFSVQVHRKTQKRQEKKVEGEGSELVRAHVTPGTLEGGGEQGIMSLLRAVQIPRHTRNANARGIPRDAPSGDRGDRGVRAREIRLQ
jgi:hypothetical protein